MTPVDSPRLADTAAVFRGGPWNGWWLAGPRLLDNRQAARNLGHTPQDLPGVSLGYQATEEFETAPGDRTATIEGRVWRWNPALTPTTRSAAA